MMPCNGCNKRKAWLRSRKGIVGRVARKVWPEKPKARSASDFERRMGRKPRRSM